MKKQLFFRDEKSNKFWHIETKGKSFTVTFGKIGTDGQSQTKEFDSEDICLNEAEKLLKEKLKKGYVEEEASNLSTASKKTATNPVKETKEKKETPKTGFKDIAVNPITEVKDLKGGCLAEIMAFYMLNEKKSQQKFLEIVAKNKGKYDGVLKNYEKLYGYLPAKELVEIQECLPAYGKYFDDISDVWMIGGGIDYTKELIPKFSLEKLINDYFFILTILTGLEKFGDDPCGDSCYLDTLPNQMEAAQVLVYDHETGKFDGYTAYSIADFVSDRWSNDWDEEEDEEIEKNTPAIKKIIDSFNIEAKKHRGAKAFYHTAETLFKRAHWLMGHTCGEPIYAFAEKMSDAPDFKTWQKEKELVAVHPTIANYWLLAHFFLGNFDSCKECVELAKKTPGMVTPALAQMIEIALNNMGKPGFKFGKLKSAELLKLIELTQKNAAVELLEPSAKQKIEVKRGDDKIKRLTEAEFNKQIAEKVDPVRIMEDFPDDIETHDRVLKEIGKKEEAFLKLVNQYFNERGRDSYNEWPYSDKIDKRFSIPVSAAFISGLKFDSDNKKSFSGITQTLAKLDDDNAMKAYRSAFELLNPADERLEYVIEGLRSSKHPASKDIILFASARFFEVLDAADENEKKLQDNRKKHGNTLDNMFGVKNFFLEILHIVFSWKNENSLELAEKILKQKRPVGIWGTALGESFKTMGNNKVQKVVPYLNWYIDIISKIEAEDERTFLDEKTSYNFTEAVIALTKMKEADTEKKLQQLYTRKTIASNLDLEIKSGVIGGLLMINSNDKELIACLERLLGNRNNRSWIYGALRAAAEAKFSEENLEKVKSWVKYHVFSDTNSFMEFHKVIKNAAYETMEVLGEKCSLFDESDQYGTGLKSAQEVAAAFLNPGKYLPGHLCDRIIEKKYTHPELVQRLGEYLLDLLKFSKDDKEIEYRKAMKALLIQGKNAYPAFEKISKLEFLDDSCYTDLVYYLRSLEEEASILKWVVSTSNEEVIAQLNQPGIQYIAWLDLLAAHAFFIKTEASVKAIENAFVRRMEKFQGYITQYNDEPTAVRLAMIYAALGEKCQQKMQRMLNDDYCSSNEIIKIALESVQKKTTEKTPSFSGKIKLIDKISGEYSSGPHHFIEIECNKNLVKIIYQLKEAYFYDTYPGRDLSNTSEIVCENEAKAMELANSIINECLLLGYKENIESKKKK